MKKVMIGMAMLTLVGCSGLGEKPAINTAVSQHDKPPVTLMIVNRARELADRACNGKSQAARLQLVGLYRTFVDPAYPEGGVCEDPLNVLSWAIQKGVGDVGE